MMGSWNIIGKATASATIPGQTKHSSSLPSNREELSPKERAERMAMRSSAPVGGPGGSLNNVERMQHVTKIIHRHRSGGSKKLNLATALLSHSKLANIVAGASKNKIASPPAKRNSLALQKFKAKARRIIEIERDKKQVDATVDQHPRLDYLNHQAYEYLRKCEYTKQQILKEQDRIKRAKKQVGVLWKLRREYQHKKDHERRWTPRDVEHREFDLVTAKKELSVTTKLLGTEKIQVDESRKNNLAKRRQREQIQQYIDKLVMQQERHVRKVHEMEALTDVMEAEHFADVRADRKVVLTWEMEYDMLCRECKQLERKGLERRMKETKHLVRNGGEVNVSERSSGTASDNTSLTVFMFFIIIFIFTQVSATKVGLGNIFKHALGGEQGSNKGKINIVQEMRLRSKNNKLNWQVAKQKIFVKLRATTVKEAEDGMLKLRAETGLHNVEELVKWYEENEQKHYDVFKRLDENESQLAFIRTNIQKLRKDLSVFSGHGNVTNHVKNEIAKRAQDRIVAFKRATDACKANYEHSNRLLKDTCTPIDKIFERLGERESETNTLLTAKGVTNLTVMAFLGIIDQRIAEILQFQEMIVQEDVSWGNSMLQRRSKDRRSTSPHRTPAIISKDLTKQVQPPSVNEVASALYNTDADGEPAEDVFATTILTKDQLKLKSVDFYAIRENLKSQRSARALNQKEQVERMQGKGDVDGLSPIGLMRRMRKGTILNK